MTIRRNENSEITKTIREMEDSSIVFYLTGSRFFGSSNDNSDYDFFIQKDTKDKDYVSELENFQNELLLSLGFRIEAYAEYSSDDSQIVDVWIHETLPIHIQVVSNAALKDIAQKHLYDIIPGRLMSLKDTHEERRARVYYWKMAYEYASMTLKKYDYCPNWQPLAERGLKVTAIKIFREEQRKVGGEFGLLFCKKVVEDYMGKYNIEQLMRS